MRISLLSIFPEMFGDFLAGPIPSRAVRKGIAELQVIDIKDFAPGSFRRIDDSPYGGGAGMILRCQPVLDALASVRGKSSHVICFAPAGHVYTQADAHRLAAMDDLIFLCGHYEGMDARIYSHTDEMISVGDFILSGGELCGMLVVDSILRLLPGCLRAESTQGESFENGLLEYPQYTRPASYNGEKVPDVLLSGNHEEIRRWRLRQSLLLTKKLRPDLFLQRVLTEEETELLSFTEHPQSEAEAAQTPRYPGSNSQT